MELFILLAVNGTSREFILSALIGAGIGALVCPNDPEISLTATIISSALTGWLVCHIVQMLRGTHESLQKRG